MPLQSLLPFLFLSKPDPRLHFQPRSQDTHTHTQEKVKSTESVKPQNYLSFVSASQLYALPNGLYILFQAPGSEVQQSVINTVEAKQCKEWRLTWKTQPKESRDECMLVQDNSPQGNNTHHCLSKQKSNQTHTVNARTHTHGTGGYPLSGRVGRIAE